MVYHKAISRPTSFLFDSNYEANVFAQRERRKIYYPGYQLSLITLVLQVDRLEDELVGEQEKYKAITEELEQTFAEMSGY